MNFNIISINNFLDEFKMKNIQNLKYHHFILGYYCYSNYSIIKDLEDHTFGVNYLSYRRINLILKYNS